MALGVGCGWVWFILVVAIGGLIFDGGRWEGKWVLVYGG